MTIHDTPPCFASHPCQSWKRLRGCPHFTYGASEPEGKEAFPRTSQSLSMSMDKDSPDVHQDLNALKTKFQEVRKAIGSMPGIHLSPEQQQQQLHSLREQVRTKNELLQKYKSLCMFEIPKD
ncbi:mediator of RNA polymerase II transcription subunit 9 isoform X2 [Loxodonta africana]|uniref:mediator of RNA polymerase II transcription subunit 9 isoform X2 n=1 Tax=Loxodonta africana TaxID=9785 RepID=UPI000C811D98|nr:mediator of RNA polymerase II transcription subunit 9 isoform X2 [Loxodonta africana]XP_049730717.1 mediator of RNA polymerase II transcription subunit 9 isoform X2 [Elephas maximus indicus]